MLFKFLFNILFKILENDFVENFLQRYKYPRFLEFSLWFFFFSLYFIAALILKKILIFLYFIGGQCFIYSYGLFPPESYMWLKVHYAFKYYCEINLKIVYLKIIFADIFFSLASFWMKIPIVNYYVNLFELFVEALVLEVLDFFDEIFSKILYKIFLIIEFVYKSIGKRINENEKHIEDFKRFIIMFFIPPFLILRDLIILFIFRPILVLGLMCLRLYTKFLMLLTSYAKYLQKKREIDRELAEKKKKEKEKEKKK